MHGDLKKARISISYLVGRDTGSLSEEEVAKACVETIAENTTDGVIAPLFYLFIGGVPLGMAYKAVNTLDSMVGYRNEEFEYLGKQIERLRSLGRIRSCEAMQSTLHSFRKFRGEIDISFTKLDKDVIEQYEAYLRNRGLSRNTTSFYMRNFRSAYRTAVEEGITNDVHPFCKVYTGVDKTTKRAITIDDIRRIKYLNTSNRPALDFAKDILLFSFYTRGMSFVDMAYLRKKDIANGYITYYRKKTGQQLSVELVPDILDIISKYHNETQYLLPLILVENGTERKQYRNQMMKINRNLKKIGKMINLSVPLSTYVARHAWATIARDKGISLSVISKGLGHDSEITTQIYLDSLQNSKIDKANRLILSDL